jgi:transposase-like protein
MTNGRVEIITTVQRRRRWSTAEKQRIVAASLERGAVASAVAREAGIHVSQLFRWRQGTGLAVSAPLSMQLTASGRISSSKGTPLAVTPVKWKRPPAAPWKP